MTICRSSPLILLLVALLASCAAAVDPLVHEEAITPIRLELDAKDWNAYKVPRLHERTPETAPDATIELCEPDAGWIGAVQNKKTSVRLLVKLTAKAKDHLLIATIWDWENRAIQQVVCSSDKPHEMNFAVEGKGVYLITLDGFEGDEVKKHLYRNVRSFAVLPDQSKIQERWKTSDYWLGICAFPGRYHWSNGGKPSKPEAISEEKAREIEVDAMAKLGLTVARLDVSMVLPEKETAPIDWKRMDAAVSAYTSRGFELALQLMHPPDWAMEEKYKSETKDTWRFPRREEPYRRYVREIVSRYGKHAKFVQVYNEPDQVEFWAATPAEYVTEVNRAREEIRKVLPEIPVGNGGYAFIDPKKTEYFTRELKGKLELQAYHSHGNLRELIRDIDQMRALHKDAGYDKPRFINTESGFAAWRLDQERAQAASVVHKILYSWAHGDEGMLLFASRMTKAPGRSGRDFGFLDYDFCPRFVYGTVSALVEQLAGARFERVLVESNDLNAYVFRKGEKSVIACFSIGELKVLNISTDARSVKCFDAMGNERASVNDREGNISMNLTPSVKWLVLEGATRIEMVK